MISLVLLLAAAPTSTSTGSEVWLDRVIAGRGPMPALADVQDAAEAALGTSTERATSWARRARLRGWVPRVDVGVGTDADLDIRDSQSASRTLTTTEGRAFGFEVSARWNLAELVLSETELRANREALARSSAAQRVRERVTKIYFDRLAVLIELSAKPSAALHLRARRLDARLRALTGGRLERARENIND